MSKPQGTFIIVLLAVLVVLAIYAGYIRKRPVTRYEYRAADGDKIDLASLQNAGSEGWDCAVTGASGGGVNHYVIVCKRPLP